MPFRLEISRKNHNWKKAEWAQLLIIATETADFGANVRDDTGAFPTRLRFKIAASLW